MIARNRFYLSDDSEEELGEPVVVEVSEHANAAEHAKVAEPVVTAAVGEEPAYRQWVKEESRFTGDDLKHNIFNSPFSKKRFQKRDDDGWVSIHWNRPQFQEEDVMYEIREADYPVLSTETKTMDHEISAVVWAERIRKSLEKAEAMRGAKRERLSFFKRIEPVREIL